MLSLERSFHEMLERLEAERRSAASAALNAQEKERARIARDLHDEVNQALTGLLLRLEALRRGTDDPEIVGRARRDQRAGLAGDAGAARPGPRRLRPTTLDDLGLKAALATLVEEVDQAAGIAAGFEAEGDLAASPRRFSSSPTGSPRRRSRT